MTTINFLSYNDVGEGSREKSATIRVGCWRVCSTYLSFSDVQACFSGHSPAGPEKVHCVLRKVRCYRLSSNDERYRELAREY